MSSSVCVCVRVCVWGIIIINTQSSKDCHYQVESAKKKKKKKTAKVYRQIYTVAAGLCVCAALLERMKEQKKLFFFFSIFGCELLNDSSCLIPSSTRERERKRVLFSSLKCTTSNHKVLFRVSSQ